MIHRQCKHYGRSSEEVFQYGIPGDQSLMDGKIQFPERVTGML